MRIIPIRIPIRRKEADPWDRFPAHRFLSSYGWCPEPAGTWWARVRGGIVREAVFLPAARGGPLGRRFRRVRGRWAAWPLAEGTRLGLGWRTPGRRALGTLPCAAALLQFDGRERIPKGNGDPEGNGDGFLEGRFPLGPRGTDLRVLIRAMDLDPPPDPPWGAWRETPGRVPAALAGGAAAVALFRAGPRAWIVWREGRILHIALARGRAIRFAGWIVLAGGDGPAACTATLRRSLAEWPTQGAERTRTLGLDPFVARLFGADVIPLAPTADLPPPLAGRPAALVAIGCAILAASPWAKGALRPGNGTLRVDPGRPPSPATRLGLRPSAT